MESEAVCLVAVLGLALSGAATAQWIETRPSSSEQGEAVAVVALDAAGRPMPGVGVVARGPEGRVLELGATDAYGEARWQAEAVGLWELRASLPAGPLLVVAHEVRAPRRRWLWAGLCVPAGLALLGLHVARWRRARG